MNRFALMLDYSFSTVTKNWKAVAVFFLFIIVLFIFHFIPLLSFVGQVALSLLITQLEVYYGRRFLTAESREELLSFLTSSTVGKVYTDNIHISSAIFLASFLITSALTVITVGLLFLTGLAGNIDTVEDALLYGLVYFLLVSTLWLFFLYLVPLGIGYAMSKNNFGEAFIGFFRIFTPSFWKKAFSFRYFKLISLGGLLFTVFAVVAVIFMITLVLLPLGVAVFYLDAVFWGALCAESYRITFLEPDNGTGVDKGLDDVVGVGGDSNL